MLFEKNDKIVFIGDSITDCGRAKPVGWEAFGGWGHGYVANVGSLLGSRNPELNLRIVNMGIDGSRIVDLEGRWEKDVIQQKPDWVMILIGINDVWRQFDCPREVESHVLPEQYEEVYVRLLERTKPAVKGIILMTPYYIESMADPMRVRMDEYGAIVKRLAAQYDLPVIDLQAMWDRVLLKQHAYHVSPDRVHPNMIGSMHIAREFLNSIGFEW